ncbi:MAG TPA: EAL domain-containing protein [Asticcacaulis sp.]|nr:EAL domain-containing protein [Asticcacaulis sp.]
MQILLWRRHISPKARTLLVLTFVAGASLLVALIALLYSSLATITAKTNEIDARRSTEAVQAAVDSSLSTISAVLVDNGVWDDAVSKTYRPVPDKSWLYLTWGAVSNDSHVYDGAYVADEHFHVLWGWFRDEEFKNDSASFGNGFAALIKAHAADLDKGGDPVVGLTRTAYGPAVVGINLIRPATGAFHPKGAERRYLIMTRHISPSAVAGMTRTFRIKGLALNNLKPAKGPNLSLTGADGQAVAWLSWTPRLPGVEAARAAAPRIQRITVVGGLLILMFVGVSGYSLHKLGKSEKLAHTTALTDGLSGLPNRRALYERLEKAGKGKSSPQRTVVFIDLDGFKDVNDIYGHDTGDKLICIVADALKARIPERGMLARLGGDEFALLVGGQDADAACNAFAKSALNFLHAPIRIGERTIQIGASIGIASADLNEVSSQELFRRADMAMYHSKSTGKGRITRYDAKLDAVRLHNQDIETGIREGLLRSEFDVLYQPILDARSQAVVAVEALVRWPGRPGGPLGPDQFISIAETSGLIHPLGQFVLKKACADLKAVPDLKLSVNISPAQFRDPDFEHKVGSILKATGFPVERLELEVTEGYLIENPDRAIAAIKTLKGLGVSMALDDFGTGYSSIGYLRRYDFDKIKIDKSLAGLVDRDPQAAALVAGTVSIANALSIEVTAEGVETEEHVRLLRLAGCQHLQGFYFSKPRPLAEVVGMRGEWETSVA